MGVNIITPGSGYSNPPLLEFQDACGKGKGGRGIAIIGTVMEILVLAAMGLHSVVLAQVMMVLGYSMMGQGWTLTLLEQMVMMVMIWYWSR